MRPPDLTPMRAREVIRANPRAEMPLLQPRFAADANTMPSPSRPAPHRTVHGNRNSTQLHRKPKRTSSGKQAIEIRGPIHVVFSLQSPQFDLFVIPFFNDWNVLLFCRLKLHHRVITPQRNPNRTQLCVVKAFYSAFALLFESSPQIFIPPFLNHHKFPPLKSTKK